MALATVRISVVPPEVGLRGTTRVSMEVKALKLSTMVAINVTINSNVEVHRFPVNRPLRVRGEKTDYARNPEPGGAWRRARGDGHGRPAHVVA